MSFRSLLNSTVNIQRRTKITDGAGGFTPGWANIATNVPCRIQPMSGGEQTLYRKENTEVTHKLFFETDVTFAEEDRIVFGTKKFDIELVRDIDELSHHLEVEVRELVAK